MNGGTRPGRSDVALILVGAAAGAIFLASLGSLWPLIDGDLTADPDALRATAREALAGLGHDLAATRSASVLTVDSDALEWLERTYGRERTRAWIRAGVPLAEYQVAFKRPGDPRSWGVFVLPDGAVSGWSHALEEDDPGPSLDEDAARARAVDAVRAVLRVDPDAWEERSVSTVERPARRDHRFTWERVLADDPETRERVVVDCAGDEIALARRYVVVPGPGRRAAIAAEAPGRAMESIGFALLAVFATAAFLVFLVRLRAGSVRLWRSAALAGVVFLCLAVTWSLQTGWLFQRWQPLWPEWISTLQTLVGRMANEVWMTLVLLALIGAGDALDRESGADRGASLWRLLTGGIADPAVGLASLRGVAVGLVCGGVMTVAVLALELAGGATALQPRGFFFYALNSASPAVSTLLFFLNVALLEELGYRFFAGTWLLAVTRRRAVAIVLPAVVYGLTHTRLDFLPVAEPWWGRAFVLTVVGCVWGWAFLRYGALAVVLSHWTADLFIFNWPRLASGKPVLVAIAAATVAVPAIPAALAGVAAVLRRRRRSRVAAPPVSS